MKQNSQMEMPFLEHIRELRKRFYYIFIAVFAASTLCLIFAQELAELLMRPLYKSGLPTAAPLLHVTSFTESLVTKVQLSIIAGILIAFPFILYQIIRFIIPGLHPRERRFVLSVITASSLLSLFSIYFSFFQILPLSIDFLRSFIADNVKEIFTYSKSLFFVLQFMLGAMVLFQFPVVLMLLMLFKFVTRTALLKSSRYIIIAIFIAAAILTPPDPSTQVMVALPLVLFFYLTILTAKLLKIGEA